MGNRLVKRNRQPTAQNPTKAEPQTNTQPKQKRQCYIYTRLKIGHTAITHRFLLNQDDKPSFCISYNTNQPIKRILSKYTEFSSIRKKILVAYPACQWINENPHLKGCIANSVMSSRINRVTLAMSMLVNLGFLGTEHCITLPHFAHVHVGQPWLSVDRTLHNFTTFWPCW